MTIALTKFAAYGEYNTDTNKIRGIQCIKMTLTGAATDVAYDLSDFSGTFWTSVDNTDVGAGVKAWMYANNITEALVAVEGDFTQSYLRGAATGAGVYTQTVSNKLPIITFHTSDAPTSMVLIMKWSLADGVVPLAANFG